jgi:hypothetical protein
VILGERLKFTLFSTGEGVSIEAELVQTDVAPPRLDNLTSHTRRTRP